MTYNISQARLETLADMRIHIENVEFLSRVMQEVASDSIITRDNEDEFADRGLNKLYESLKLLSSGDVREKLGLQIAKEEQIIKQICRELK